jgi:hypothetical protein
MMNQNQTNAYVRKHGVKLPNGQYMLTSPLYAFKKVYGESHRESIANLVIPIGAIVNLAQTEDCKLRASQAYCHSIALQYGGQSIRSACSGHRQAFKYTSGTSKGLTTKDFQGIVLDHENYVQGPRYVSTLPIVNKLKACKVVPDSFDTYTSECSNGIHFFVELQRAKNW